METQDNKENPCFRKALSNFVHDSAAGGAIRHLADMGYTVSEIKNQLDFPTPQEKVAETVWKHDLDTGLILTDRPEPGKKLQTITFEPYTGAYGRIEFRRVVTEKKLPWNIYYACDFGRQLYKDRKGFLEKTERLDRKDRDYLLELSWPLTTCYHGADERMQRIYRECPGIFREKPICL